MNEPTPHLTAEEQLDVLWRALQDRRFWISIDGSDSLVMQQNVSSAHTTGIGAVQEFIHGSRQTIIEKLHARQVADRLNGVTPSAKPKKPKVPVFKTNTF